LLVVCSSKDYLQKAKKGEGVLLKETQVRNNKGQARTTTTRGARGTLEKLGSITRVVTGKE
jgi:hypothetical protein